MELQHEVTTAVWWPSTTKFEEIVRVHYHIIEWIILYDSSLTWTCYSTTMTAGFGAAALLAVAFLMEDVPVVRKDIYQNLPIIGHYWDRTVAPEDNPF